MIRYESIITALIGGVLGIALGIVLALILAATALSGTGFVLVIPVVTMIVLFVLAGLAGLAAAAWPARRAAKRRHPGGDRDAVAAALASWRTQKLPVRARRAGVGVRRADGD